MHAAAALQTMHPQCLKGKHFAEVLHAVQEAHSSLCRPHSGRHEQPDGQNVDLRALPGLQEQLESSLQHLQSLQGVGGPADYS